MSPSDLHLARSLDERLVAARTAEPGAVHCLAVLLWELADRALYRVLGYTPIQRYAAVALDLTGRVARDLLRIGRRLPELAALNAAMAAGELDWSKAREIVRVATPETEASWVDRARTESARVIELEAAVVDMRPGPDQGHASRVNTPVLRWKLLHRAGWKCEVPGCTSRLWLDVHHLRFRSRGAELGPQALPR